VALNTKNQIKSNPMPYVVVRDDCSFCWYWWNCRPSLFKLSLDERSFEILKSMFSMKLFEERLDYYIKEKISKSCKNNYVRFRSELWTIEYLKIDICKWGQLHSIL
jgi:hypothetical protein